MASLSLQLLTVSIITLQRQIQHNYYGSGQTPANCTQYDYIVVGGGTAGCVVAARLAQNPAVNVLLLEAGGPQTVITDMPGNTLFLVGGEFDWNYHVVPQTSAGLAYPNFFISRGISVTYLFIIHAVINTNRTGRQSIRRFIGYQLGYL
jgi:hypothetical protein